MMAPVARQSQEAGAEGPGANERVLVVYSPAGGTGKSEIAANIAYHLAKSGYRIWLIDANTQFPTLDLILCAPVVEGGLIDVLMNPGTTSFLFNRLSPPSIGRPFTGELLFTPAGRSNVTEQTLLSEMAWDSVQIERVQDALLSRIDDLGVDLCIIDTHLGFDLINRIWLGITSHLLLISRLNDLDLRNLRVFLEDQVLKDICQTMLIFNNVQVSARSPDSPRYLGIERDLENEVVTERVEAIVNGEIVLKSIWTDCDAPAPGDCALEVFHHAFAYSPALARYTQDRARLSVFSEEYPADSFSITVRECADHLMSEWFGRRRD